MTDRTKLLPSLERSLYDEKYGTDTRYGLGPDQIFVDPTLAKSTITAILNSPNREFDGVDIDAFVNNNLNFNTPNDIITTMNLIYETFRREDVNYIFFEILKDAFSTKSKFEEIFKTSWVALQIEQRVDSPNAIPEPDLNIQAGGGCFTAPALTPTLTASVTVSEPELTQSATPTVTPTPTPSPSV
jgi:hypothetical protein